MCPNAIYAVGPARCVSSQRVEVLCCDKTGTLTQNKMHLTEAMPAFLEGVTGDDLLTAAALATRWWEPPGDALDALVLSGVDTSSLGDYEQVEFFPFDPLTRRTESTLRRKDGSMFKARAHSLQKVACMRRL